MVDQTELVTTVPSNAELAEWDAAVEQAVDGLKGKKREAASIAADAVQFISASHEDLETVSKQGFFGRVWDFLTGRNSRLRERSQCNVLHGQKAALKLVQRLAEQNALQMDAMVALANLVNYLHFTSVKTKKILLDLFNDHEARLRKLENRLDIVDRVTSWAFMVKNQDYIELPNRSLRLAAFVQEALDLDVSEWHTRHIGVFETALLDAGFRRRETITIRGFLHDLSQAEEAPGWKEYVLPLVEPGLEHVSECGLPCYYALLESAELQRSDEKYSIVAVATDMAAAGGSRLDPVALREEVLVRYLTGRGVNVDAKVPLAKLGVELLVGARTMSTEMTEVGLHQETESLNAQPADPSGTSGEMPDESTMVRFKGRYLKEMNNLEIMSIIKSCISGKELIEMLMPTEERLRSSREYQIVVARKLWTDTCLTGNYLAFWDSKAEIKKFLGRLRRGTLTNLARVARDRVQCHFKYEYGIPDNSNADLAVAIAEKSDELTPKLAEYLDLSKRILVDTRDTLPEKDPSRMIQAYEKFKDRN